MFFVIAIFMGPVSSDLFPEYALLNVDLYVMKFAVIYISRSECPLSLLLIHVPV